MDVSMHANIIHDIFMTARQFYDVGLLVVGKKRRRKLLGGRHAIFRY